MFLTTLLIIAVVWFIVSHFLPERRTPAPERKYRVDPRAVVSNPDWQAIIEEHCESPAEVEFLKAMIDVHGLLPDEGSLRSSGMKIDFQVEVGRYRLDFLANDWLVIEIDGAMWHSSEAAMARDAKRDNYFTELGYSVVRIPAKVVFNNPREAVHRVATALEKGKPVIMQPVQKSGFERLGETASSAGKFFANLDSTIDRVKVVKQALSEADLAFSAEKKALTSAIQSAELSLSIEDEIGDDAEMRKDYDSFYRDLKLAMKKSDHDSGIDASTGAKVAQFKVPPATGNEDADSEIRERFAIMNAERDELLQEVRTKLSKDKRLTPLVRDNLNKYGCPQMWHLVAL
ncbi:endonuclease domain-containing protein [Sphingomonas sp. Ag1]|jgi:very-short-patch-repair endonuclease|uniref:endonuclease domain-containing protein n=1 Tax=Sphingomonas sp. Ag1 TaxID=1642949 RepID=UPI0009E252F4|nr:DUF559 domain-containing protein [Sphingomonas sp. Ag1]